MSEIKFPFIKIIPKAGYESSVSLANLSEGNYYMLTKEQAETILPEDQARSLYLGAKMILELVLKHPVPPFEEWDVEDKESADIFIKAIALLKKGLGEEK